MHSHDLHDNKRQIEYNNQDRVDQNVLDRVVVFDLFANVELACNLQLVLVVQELVDQVLAAQLVRQEPNRVGLVLPHHNLAVGRRRVVI